MELKEAMLKRRSIRKYSDKEVSDSDIDYLLHLGMSGPSACNRTPWEFYVIKNEEIRKKLRKSSIYSNIVSPLIIVVAGNTLKSLRKELTDFWIQDCAAAIENILLAATSIELGSCWVGLLPQKKSMQKVTEILNLDTNIIPLGMVYIGYKKEEALPRDQYNVEKIHYIL